MTVFVIELGVIVAWLACGVAGAGWFFSDFQWGYPSLAVKYRREDFEDAILMAIFGPVSMVLCFVLSGFGKHGWWRPCPGTDKSSSGPNRA